MWDFLAGVDGWVLVAIVGGVTWIVGWSIATVASNWRRMRLGELEIALKQQMVERGMSVAEMEQVLKATRDERTSGPKFTGNAAFDRAALVAYMVKHEWEPEDIERVIRAYECHPDGRLEADQWVANQS